MGGDRGRLAVVRIDEDAIGKMLQPLAEPFELAIERLLDARREAELRHLARGVALDELARRALGDDARLVHHHEPVAQLLGLVHVVRGQHQRHAALLEPVEPVPHEVPGLRVEAGRRLVEEHQLGSLMSDRAIERRRFMPPDSGSTWLVGAIRRAGRTRAARRRAWPPRPAAGRSSGRRSTRFSWTVSSVSSVSCCGTTPRRARIRGPSIAGSRPRIRERAGRDRRHAADHPHRRGLAGAVRAQEAERLALRDVEVDGVDRRELAEPLRQAAGMDERGVASGMGGASRVIPQPGPALPRSLQTCYFSCASQSTSAMPAATQIAEPGGPRWPTIPGPASAAARCGSRRRAHGGPRDGRPVTYPLIPLRTATACT